MKRILPLLLVLLAWTHPLAAQETPENELELVRALRAKATNASEPSGFLYWNSLARERAEALLKSGNPLLTAALPIELAKINIAEAMQKGPDARIAMLTTAHGQLQDFINKNPNTVAAALATAELARVTTYQGQAILSGAMREENDKARHERAKPAELKFIEAGENLKKALAALDAALKNPVAATEKAMLEKEQRQARFDSAKNIYDRARTQIDKSSDAVNRKRSFTMKEAKEEFTKLRSDESSEVGWLANAWLMKVYMEMQDQDNVNKFYEFVMTRKDMKEYQPDIQPAVRLVKFFALQDVTLPRDDEPETIGLKYIATKAKKTYTAKQQLEKVQTDGQAWLTAHPTYHGSPEGQGVLFEVAYAYYTEAESEKDKKAAAVHIEKALTYFDKLAKADSDLGFRARLLSRSIKYHRLDLTKELKTFEDLMIKAEKERRAVIAASVKLDAHAKKVGEANGDAAKLKELEADKKAIDADRKQHLKDIIATLTRAQLVTTSLSEIDEARSMLCGAYVAYGDSHRAAIVAEALARARTSRAHEGAQTALHTYSTMLAKEPGNAVVKQRLQDMADFILSPESQRTWKDEQVTSLAHYHLAMAARENDPKTAVFHLEKIRTNFVDYSYTQGQAALIAEAARQKLAEEDREQGTNTKKEQKEFLEAAKRAVGRMPKLHADDSPNVVTMYFFAKVEMSKHIYADAMEKLNANEELGAVKFCNDMAKYVKDLRIEYDNVKGSPISKEHREQLEFTMDVMLKYADFGIAESKFRSDRAGRFDEVLAATKKVVDTTVAKAKEAKDGEPIRMRDYRVTGDILGLALRASVQKGDVDKGKAILDVLQRLTGTDGQKPGPIVAVLLNDIASQIDSMKKKSDTKALAETKKNYTAFLDVIQKEIEGKGKAPDNNQILMMAHAYKSLDDPAKAAALFGKVKPTVNLDQKFDKKKEKDEDVKARQAWENEATRYWAVQIEYIRALRACKDKESTAKAIAAADRQMTPSKVTNEKPAFWIQAWMEKAHLLEDPVENKYFEAYNEWVAILKVLGPGLSKPEVQKLYFPAYFEWTRSYYKLGAFDTRIKGRQKIIDAAAANILKLETSKTKVGWELAGPLFKEYLKEKEADQLKKAYDALKKAAGTDTPKKGAAAEAPRRELAHEIPNLRASFEIARFEPRSGGRK